MLILISQFLLHLEIHSHDRMYVYEAPLMDHFRSSLSAQTLIQVQAHSTSPSAHAHTSHLQLWDPLLTPPRDPTQGSYPPKNNLEV